MFVILVGFVHAGVPIGEDVARALYQTSRSRSSNPGSWAAAMVFSAIEAIYLGLALFAIESHKFKRSKMDMGWPVAVGRNLEAHLHG